MQRMRQIAQALSIFGAALLAAAASPAQDREAYRIGPRDMLSIKVFEDPRFNAEIRVAEDGTIRFPPLGDVAVKSFTANELGAELKRLLELDTLQRATVTVEIREFRSRPIAVIGAVRTPGPLDVSGRMTLIEAITAAGGLATDHGKVIYVLRRANNGLTDQVAVPIDELMVRADPVWNIPIFDNDLINVQATVEVTIYCLGEVRQPGALVFKSTERVSLLAAIARAGGLNDRASKRILIKRGTPTASGPDEIFVDYKRILAGREPDVELAQGDVVVVKESFF